MPSERCGAFAHGTEHEAKSISAPMSGSIYGAGKSEDLGRDPMSRLANFLACRFPENGVAPGYFSDLLSTYGDSGLAPPNLMQEVTSGDDGKFWPYVWEALLYRHLLALGYEFRRDHLRKSGQHGPDFGIILEGRTAGLA
jgi:hypothetical protein